LFARDCRTTEGTNQKRNRRFVLMTAITPMTNPKLWYSWYEIVKEDAPEVLDEFLENTAAKMELPVDYLMQEFL